MRCFILGIIFSLLMLNNMNAWAESDYNIDFPTMFKKAKLIECDKLYKEQTETCKLDEGWDCLYLAAGLYADCWKRSMNNELNKRLSQLKKEDRAQFKFETTLQKNFTSAAKSICGKHCGPSKIAPVAEEECFAAAYKYRTQQAMDINNKTFSIPLVEMFLLEKTKTSAEKRTALYKSFYENICRMPKEVWKKGSAPEDCEKLAFAELDGFEFTDDVCGGG